MKRRWISTRKGKNEAREVDHAQIQNSGSSITNLPEDILLNILPRISIKGVIICKSVCKTWNHLISDPKFAELHFRQPEVCTMIRTFDRNRLSRILYLVQPELCNYYQEGYRKPECKCYDDLKLDTKLKLPLNKFDELVNNNKEVASVMNNPECQGEAKRKHCIRLKTRQHRCDTIDSCNGFLCLSKASSNYPPVIYNPVMGEFINLPQSEEEEDCRCWYCGFRFSPVADQYKVIRMLNHWIVEPNTGQMWLDGWVDQVHPLGTRSWRDIGYPLYKTLRLDFITYLNGAIHWLCLNSQPKDCIVSFNFDNECFGSFSPPPSFSHHGYSRDYSFSNVTMGVLGGSLCICNNFGCSPMVVWVMKHYGVEESWTQVFSIRPLEEERWPLGLNQPIKFLSGGGLLMFNYSDSAFVYYDPRKNRFEYFWVLGIKSGFQAIVHTPSLMSLKHVLLVGNMQVLNAKSR